MKKLTARELADLISTMRGDLITVNQIRKGKLAVILARARGSDLNSRVVRYDRQKALEDLKFAGII